MRIFWLEGKLRQLSLKQSPIINWQSMLQWLNLVDTVFPIKPRHESSKALVGAKIVDLLSRKSIYASSNHSLIESVFYFQVRQMLNV